jgi:hypothetical protein
MYPHGKTNDKNLQFQNDETQYSLTCAFFKFWKQFMSDYISSPTFLEKSKTEFYEVNKSSVADLKRNIAIQVELLKQVKK